MGRKRSVIGYETGKLCKVIAGGRSAVRYVCDAGRFGKGTGGGSDRNGAWNGIVRHDFGVTAAFHAGRGNADQTGQRDGYERL